ncbi:MAG TPA: PKD domain-containing protein [Clostridia bacterium]|nr:PKD domain-containing protein [Clostridia bacterium]
MNRMKLKSILLALFLLSVNFINVIITWSDSIQDYRTVAYEDDVKKPLLKPTAQFALTHYGTKHESPIGKDLNSNAKVVYVTVGDTVSIQDMSRSNRGKSLKAWDFQFTRPDGDNQFIETKAFEKSYSLDKAGTYTFSLCVRDTVENEAWTFYWGNWSDNGNHRVIGNNPGKNLSDPSDDFDGYWYFTRIVVIAREKSYTLQEKHIDTDAGIVLSETQHEGIAENTYSTSAESFTGYKFIGSRAGYTWSEISNGKTENISSRTANFDSSHINAFHYYYYQKLIQPPPPAPGKADIFVYYKDKVSGEAVYPADETTYKGVPYGKHTITAKPDTARHKLDRATSPSPQIVTVDAVNNLKKVTFYYIPEEPAQPPSDNQSPCAVIRGPSEEKAGEDVRWNGSGSYDFDGEIVSYSWTFEGATLVKNDNSRITVYYPKTGEYEIELEVTDDEGDKGYDSEIITITKPYPTADIEISGTYKENRKVHIDGTGSSSPDHYPINKYTWTFSDAANMKYQGTIGSTTKEFDAIFKTARSYTSTLRVDNTYGLSDSASKSFTIVADQNPNVNFSVTTKLLRDPKDTNQALITISNLTTSPDSDPIKKTVVFYAYDSDNDGNFDEETWKYSTNGTSWQNVGLQYSQIMSNFDIYNIAGGNPLNFTLKTNQVGKYKFEAMAIEDIRAAETIPALLVPSDYRRGDTFTSKPNAEKIVDVINAAPTVSFEVFKEKRTDIVILTDYTGTKLASLQAALNAQRATLLAHNVDVNFTIVNTAKQVAYINDKLAWYRRYGRLRYRGDYDWYNDKVLWEERQQLVSQAHALPARNPQNVEWHDCGVEETEGNSYTSKKRIFLITCDNDVNSSGIVKVTIYYNHDGTTRRIDRIDNVSATVDSGFSKEEEIKSITTNVNSIDFNSLGSIPLREGSDRFALLITDNYQMDFSKAFGSYFPFTGLTNMQLDYFKNNGFKTYIVSPAKAVDSTLLEEKITDFELSEYFTYIQTIDGSIKRIGTTGDADDKELLYPAEIGINSIKQILPDYILQNDGILKFSPGGSSYVTVSGITDASKILDNEYAITADSSLYYLSGDIATDTGLDGIETVIHSDNELFKNADIAVKSSGGTYLLVDGVVNRTIHSTRKAVEIEEFYANKSTILVIVMSGGSVIGIKEGNFSTVSIYYGTWDTTIDVYQYSSINDIVSINPFLKENGTIYRYDFDYETDDHRYYFEVDDEPVYAGVKKVIGNVIILNNGDVLCTRWDKQKQGNREDGYYYTPVKRFGNAKGLNDKDIISITEGGDYVVAYCANGDAYRQLKPPDVSYTSAPPGFILENSNIKSVYSTYKDMFCLDSNGKLYALGDSSNVVENVKKAQVCNNRILALTYDNKLYGMGFSRYGQLGIVNLQSGTYPGYNTSFRNVYNVMAKMLQPGLAYITLREILDSSPDSKYFGSGQYQASINDITNTYLNDVSYTSNCILVNDAVDYRMTYADYENDPKYAEQWKNSHEPNYFENSMGLASFHGQTLAAPVKRFDRKGRYTINVKARDNPKNNTKFKHDTNEDYNYYEWSTGNQNVLLYVHEKPVALARVTITNNGNGTYTVKAFDAGSYDRDHISRSDRGIAAREWRWKESAAITWTNGQMNKSDCTADKAYIVQLRVKDLEGAWSDYYTVEIDDDNPPVALFSLDKFIINTAEKLKVKDQSYPQSFSTITDWHWAVKKLNTDGSVPTGYVQNARFTGSNKGTGDMAGYDVNVKTDYNSPGAGKYRVYLRVKNSSGIWSDGGTDSITPADLNKYYSLDFLADKPPTAAFTIDSAIIKLEETLKLKDTSTATGISPLAKWHWIVKKLNTDGSVPSANVQSTQFADRNTGTGAMAGYDVNVTTSYKDLGAGKYRIYLRVMNGSGMWSDGGTDSTAILGSCAYRDLTVDRPPTAGFTIAKNPIAPTEKLKIKDTSGTEGFSPINRWHWIVKKYDANGTLPTTSLQDLQFTNSNKGTGEMSGYDVNVRTDYESPGVGKYRIYLRVRNSSGMWSDGGTDSAYNAGKLYYQDLMVQESFKLSNFEVTRIRDVQLESYYYNAAEGQYIQRNTNVDGMAIDRHNFGSEIKGLTKGYIFEFKINSRSFNNETDYIEITPHFYTCDDSARDTAERDLLWENSYHEILRVGEGGHSPWAMVKLTRNDRTITTGNDAVWRGLYFIPGTAWAVPDGTSAAEAKAKKIPRDIIVNFEIKGYKNGEMKYDYNQKQWPVERTTSKHPYEIGDVIRYSYNKSNLDDNHVILNRP